MPTCKYYLEGSCSRDNCPYLHVKINPKAEICRDFLEGYCQKAGLVCFINLELFLCYSIPTRCFSIDNTDNYV